MRAVSTTPRPPGTAVRLAAGRKTDMQADRGSAGGQACDVQQPNQQGQGPSIQPGPAGRPDRSQVVDQRGQRGVPGFGGPAAEPVGPAQDPSGGQAQSISCLLYTSPSPRDGLL